MWVVFGFMPFKELCTSKCSNLKTLLAVFWTTMLSLKWEKQKQEQQQKLQNGEKKEKRTMKNIISQEVSHHKSLHEGSWEIWTVFLFCFVFMIFLQILDDHKRFVCVCA